MAIVNMMGVDKICSIMALDNEEIALATCNLFQCINDSLTGGDTRDYGKEASLVLGKIKYFVGEHKVRSTPDSHSVIFMSFINLNNIIFFTADAAQELKTILLALLEMIANKKVSGHGRDQALNLLTKNVPRKDKKEKDHSRTLFTIDHGQPNRSI